MEPSTSKTTRPLRWIAAAAVAGGVLGATAVGVLGNSSNGAGSAAPATQSFVSISRTEPAAGSSDQRAGRPAETPLTGDAAEKAKAAAVAAVPGSTVDRVENDADGGSPYEAHVTKTDGSRATVKMDKDFKVTSVETDAGHRGGGHGGSGGHGPGGPGGRGDETPLTGDTAEKVKAAALGAVPGGTVDRVENDADGGSPYEAHVTTTDGSRVTVKVDKDFKVTSVDGDGGR